MSKPIEFVGVDEVRKLLDDLPSTLYKQAKLILNKAAIGTQKDTLDNFTSGSSGLSSDKINSRTGSLRRSILTSSGGSNLNDLHYDVYSNMLYAPLQEFGGIIKAKDKYRGVPGGPYLNIPLPANKTAAGVMRDSSRDIFQSGGYIGRSKLGNWLVFNAAGIPMFVLKKEVKVKGRLGMIDAAEERVKQILIDLKEMKME